MSSLGVYPFLVSSPPTPIELLRILLNDTEPTLVSAGFGDYKYLSDDEATGLLSIYNDNPRLAAAREMETIAMSEALMRRWVSDDLSLDGPATATALRQLAAQIRNEVLTEGRYEDYFDVVTSDAESGSDWASELAAWSGPIPAGIWPVWGGKAIGDTYLP